MTSGCLPETLSLLICRNGWGIPKCVAQELLVACSFSRHALIGDCVCSQPVTLPEPLRLIGHNDLHFQRIF